MEKNNLNNCTVVSIWYDPWKCNAASLFTLFGGLNLWILLVSVHLSGTWESIITSLRLNLSTYEFGSVLKSQSYQMNSGRYELDSVEWRADKLKSVSSAVVVWRLDSDQEKRSSVSWRGLHLSGCIPLLALPRIPSLSVFQDYTNPVCLNDPTNKYSGAFTVLH